MLAMYQTQFKVNLFSQEDAFEMKKKKKNPLGPFDYP